MYGPLRPWAYLARWHPRSSDGGLRSKLSSLHVAMRPILIATRCWWPRTARGRGRWRARLCLLCSRSFAPDRRLLCGANIHPLLGTCLDPIHPSDAPMVKWRHYQRGHGLRLLVLSTLNRRRDQHAVNLPGDVALEAADDLSLALAFR